VKIFRAFSIILVMISSLSVVHADEVQITTQRTAQASKQAIETTLKSENLIEALMSKNQDTQAFLQTNLPKDGDSEYGIQRKGNTYYIDGSKRPDLLAIEKSFFILVTDNQDKRNQIILDLVDRGFTPKEEDELKKYLNLNSFQVFFDEFDPNIPKTTPQILSLMKGKTREEMEKIAWGLLERSSKNTQKAEKIWFTNLIENISPSSTRVLISYIYGEFVPNTVWVKSFVDVEKNAVDRYVDQVEKMIISTPEGKK